MKIQICWSAQVKVVESAADLCLRFSHMQKEGFFHDQLIYNIQDFPGVVLNSFYSTEATYGLVFFSVCDMIMSFWFCSECVTEFF